MKTMTLIDNKIFIGEEKVELETVTFEKLKEIIIAIIDGELKVEIADDQTSPNAIFLKSLKNEINSDFINEVEEQKEEIKRKKEQLEKTRAANANYDKGMKYKKDID